MKILYLTRKLYVNLSVFCYTDFREETNKKNEILTFSLEQHFLELAVGILVVHHFDCHLPFR